jgi:ubiquinone/menaquinone biosynthesis C-methylase UbiE
MVKKSNTPIIGRNGNMTEPIFTSKWLEFVGSEEMDSRGQEALISFAANTIHSIIGKQPRTLCVGCGDGTELKYFPHAFGIDINQKSLRICREKNLQVEDMDMHHMTFNDNTFDLVFSKDNFEHSISSIEAISEFSRVSKKYVAIVLPDDSWQSSKWHFIIPTLKQMVTLGEKVNLMLRSLREYNLQIGQCNIFQSIYLFQKL